MIDFTFTEEQEMFKKAAREYAETHVAPKVDEMEKTVEVPDGLIESFGEAEMLAITIPEEYGGLGLGYTERMIAVEEISRVSMASAMMLQVFHLGIESVLKSGTEEHKKKYLPGMANGQYLSTSAVTEATGGSNPAGIRSSYKKDGDDYILNGRKCFITNSHLSNLFTVLARDEDDPKAFCAFLVDGTIEGWKATHKEHKVGMRGCNTGEMVFENCRIPKDMLLGVEGKGLRVALGAIGDVGRGGMVGCALGIHAACLEASVKFAKERILYGKPIAALQGISNKLAEMKIDLEAGTLLAYRACAMQDKGQQAGNEFAIAKYFTTEACQRAAKMGVDIHGGYGCMEEYAVSRYLRDSYVVGPSAGTSDIMKVIVSRSILA